MRNTVISMFISIIVIIAIYAIIGRFNEDFAVKTNPIAVALGLCCGSVITWLISYRKRKKDPKAQQKYALEKIENKDERNVSLRGKAGNFTFLVTLLTLGIITSIFYFMNYEIPTFISAGAVFVHIVSYLGALLYFEKKE